MYLAISSVYIFNARRVGFVNSKASPVVGYVTVLPPL